MNRMKNRYSFWMNKLWIVGFMTGCLTLSSCDDEKDLTTGMPENQLINNIVLKVTKQLPVAIGMDTTIVHSIVPANPTNPELLWTSSDESVATVAQDGTITGKAVGTAVITVMPAIGFGVTNSTLQTST